MRVVDFLAADSGAVTVDWTVLTAGLAGLGIATTAVISAGVENQSGELSGELAGQSIRTRFANLISGEDFENGAGGWMGGATSFLAGYGNVLGPFGGTDGVQSVRNTFSLTGDTAFAVVEFDVMAIDSWDSEAFTIFANNEPVAVARFQHDTDGLSGQWVTDNPDISVSITPTTGRANVTGDPGWSDQSFRVQVTVADPGDSLDVGFGTTLDQSISDESWAIDNVTVTETNDAF